MTMLGASLEDLQHLSTQLSLVGTDLMESGQATVSANDNLRAEMETSFAAALQAVNARLEQLLGTVGACRATADGTNWTGTNRAAFDAAHEQFQGNINTAQGNIAETWNNFQALLNTLSTQLGESCEAIQLSLNSGAECAESMSSSVEQQRSSLDMVMNAANLH